MIGQASISFTTQQAPAGFINVAGANDGLSVAAGGFIRLGQPAGTGAAGPAKLLDSREIPLNGNTLTIFGAAPNACSFNDDVNGVDVFSNSFFSQGFFFGFGILLGGGFNINRTTTVATGDARGYLDLTTFAGVNGIAYTSFDASAQFFSNAAMNQDHLTAYQSRQVWDSPGGTLNNLYGFTSANASKRGTTQNYYDYYAFRMNSATGVAPAVVNRYAFFCEDETRANFNWGFFNTGTSNNYFGTGKTGAGMASGTVPLSLMDLKGAFGYAQLRLQTSYTPVNSADPNGNTGDTAWDANFFYIKTAPGAWKRTAMAAF